MGDDAAQLALDGHPLLEADMEAGRRKVSATLSLEAGAHPIEIRFRNASAAQVIELSWTTPLSRDLRRIPFTALLPE